MRQEIRRKEIRQIIWNGIYERRITFNKKRAQRVPKTGYRVDGSAVYRRGSEYLIVRLDQFGSEKIVTYGINDD